MFSLLSCLYIHLGVNECCLTPNYLFVSYTITRTTVAKLALEKIQPLVRQMDAESHMDKSVLQALFDNGVSLFMWFKQF
jgi:dTDP-D-glucose 4,6-dehydratase